MAYLKYQEYHNIMLSRNSRISVKKWLDRNGYRHNFWYYVD